MKASKDGNIEEVKKLLKQGVHVDCTVQVSTISSHITTVIRNEIQNIMTCPGNLRGRCT